MQHVGGCQWPAHNVGYVITVLSVRLLFGRQVALHNRGYAEPQGGTYMYTCLVMFSLFCCVWGLVVHGAWWLVTGSGHPERLTVRAGGSPAA